MDKSSRENFPISDQAASWNAWNSESRGDWTGSSNLNSTSRRQAEVVESTIAALNRNSLDLIEIGCGTGWLCDRLSRFGRVTGTDLSEEVLRKASEKWPAIRFISGDFFTLDLQPESFDVVVTLEVLSHVADQRDFVARLAKLLKPGGMLLLATQNRPVLERWSAIGDPIPGQIRNWVGVAQLRTLLRDHFTSLQIESVVPVGDQGLLRIVNSTKLNRLLGLLLLKAPYSDLRNAQCSVIH